VIHAGVQTWCSVRKVSPAVSDLTQAATVRAGLGSQGQVHIKTGETRHTDSRYVRPVPILQVVPLDFVSPSTC
jgi:hypothetical protein